MVERTPQPLTAAYECVAEAVRFLDTLPPLALSPPSGSPPPITVVRAVAWVLRQYLEKNPGYGDSWCRRGVTGIFHNVARKFDRLEHDVLGGRPVREDDALDLATYAVLLVAWILHR